ncbi:alpha-mannosidase 2-like [Ctenocephalides felis]|uniref:alpha-mannosidase 2-like n=1 Tax=Ctenocephalides felis TaxID=7515 RepID=UPI000E6E55D9|nr:alpha-mannosidase 2-like [Ctenocephalides felis]
MVQNQADVDTSALYQRFYFHPNWTQNKVFWDDRFETRYNKEKGNTKKPHLKVILVPHSHNDAGWLLTFEQYFETKTRNILNNLVKKMSEYRKLTFVWAEICFLQTWWDQAHPIKQKAFKEFVQAGRIEIATGGWVVTDEANVHLFAMWNQLVEGHQWLKLNLNVTPTTGWSIDPFGHSSTFPYILSNSGIHRTIIQRIHFAWKQWFAWKRFGDFMWVPGWRIEDLDKTPRGQKNHIADFGHIHKSVVNNFLNKDKRYIGENKISGDALDKNPKDSSSDYLMIDKDTSDIINFGKNEFSSFKSPKTDQIPKDKSTNNKAHGEKLENDNSPRHILDYYSKIKDQMIKRPKRTVINTENMHNRDINVQNKAKNPNIAPKGKLKIKKSISRLVKPKNSILAHNMPFDLYSIDYTCGPHRNICAQFDFNYNQRVSIFDDFPVEFIDKYNVQEKAELLLEQYSKSASLFSHNVLIVPLGSDFSYHEEIQLDQQYNNYKHLAAYINKYRSRYGAEISFGTPRDYFEAIEKRTTEARQQFPKIAGDFFVYSDIYNDGEPAYWSGYYTTRPYMKILDRTVEHNLRNAEILYTIATNRARQLSQHPNSSQKYSSHLRILEKHYDSLIRARRHLALFQHHDAITGTSKQAVMKDFGLKLFEALQIANKIQEDSIEGLLVEHKEKDRDDLKGFILKDIEKESYDKLDRKVRISMSRDKRQIVMFNSLPQERSEVVIIRVNDTKIAILDDQNNEVRIQISPVWNTSTTLPQWTISDKEFEVSFIVRLPPLSLSTYSIITTKQEDPKNFATIYCNKCFNTTMFPLQPIPSGDIKLENKDLILSLDGDSGFLKTIMHKNFWKSSGDESTFETIKCNINFGYYKGAEIADTSGAYLFKPDPNATELDKKILRDLSPNIIITKGPILSELTAVYEKLLSHTTRIYNFKTGDHPSKNSELMRAVYLETLVDLRVFSKSIALNTELFLRLQTNIDNDLPPVFYADSNSFQYHKRNFIPEIEAEGNYYPITSMAFIQDCKIRLTFITDHAQGAASLYPGQLEVMLDRRIFNDDKRGMDEMLVDNKPTVFKNWLLVESVDSEENDLKQSKEYQLPSLAATRLADALNYPLNIYSVEEPNASSTYNMNNKMDESNSKTEYTTISQDRSRVPLISHPLLCDMRLINLRILSDETYHQFPGSNALLMLHRQGYSCRIGGTNPSDTCHNTRMHPDTTLTDVKIKKLTKTSLTGVKDLELVKNLGDIFVERMDLAMYRIDFA